MMSILQSKWLAALLGGLMFLVTSTVLTNQAISSLPPPAPAGHGETVQAVTKGPSWDFFNPELDHLVEELKREKESLSTREQQLKDLDLRLKSDRAELDQATGEVKKLRDELDRAVTRVKDDEVGNLKKLSKLYAGMDPAAAANILRELDEAVIVKVMLFMKNEETAPIFEAFTRQGDAETKRAARITESLRLAANIKAPPKP